MRTVAMFTDYACPWCYLGRARLKAAIRGTDATIRVLHFPLAADTPPEGRDLRAYLEGRGYDVDAAVARLRDLLAAEGMPYRTRTDSMRGWNTRKAQELAVWAEAQPGGAAIHDALFHAYQVEGANVSDVDVLAGIAEAVGLDATEARRVIEAGEAGLEVDRHWALGGKLGVTSVPTFVMGGRGLVGAQDVVTLRRFVTAPA